MALATYSDLLASVQSWLHRSDLSTQAADFITLAESELNADLHMRQMESDESVTLTVNTNTIALPSRFIEPISFELVISGQENIPLTYQPPHRLAYNTASGARCRPQIFTIDGGNIEFPNLSDATYSAVFRMVKGFDIAATTTNALLSAYPGLYLYGALLQATPYLNNDSRITTWKTMYESLLLKVKRKEGRKNALTSLASDHFSAGSGWRNNIITG
jgi:hypothetical protein